ncbi:hypothetical protein RCC89_01620 [Cytophagaceae bacterium ABcell3]|nr:hypothetical protein RCC89_01620 [Cytophagaceae bacterium ABcell3]
MIHNEIENELNKLISSDKYRQEEGIFVSEKEIRFLKSLFKNLSKSKNNAIDFTRNVYDICPSRAKLAQLSDRLNQEEP